MSSPVTEPDIPTKIVKCPNCGGASVYAASNPYRPFCSERCKQIDLGAWASEQFAVPAVAPPEDLLPD
ncbi:MAG: DNA gyrase inhibitor YacG [Betaproteobacteria bacterium HGW-Betaproteobacteria-18]|nr:MAG: DNA gyrase inhibitor YacG [Betaproteobacteria bacterium HGW-Betaproteobacteria-18]